MAAVSFREVVSWKDFRKKWSEFCRDANDTASIFVSWKDWNADQPSDR
ncbi:MAG: hypothetical protein II194_09560 [Bacteroidales bacterium]|nr:hypothetical protein [Bacteroidales bacterium]